MDQSREILERHVKLFNQGVRRNNFRQMTTQFSEGAEMSFEGIPVGPFRGREEIARAYKDQPPDDEIDILDVEEKGGGKVLARYAWSKNPKTRAGELEMETIGGQITKLIIRYEK